MSKKRIKSRIIKIPHLNLQIVVEKLNKKNKLEGAGAYTEKLCNEEYKMVLPLPIRGKKTASTLVHEIIHVLQHIVTDTTASFDHEREHTAYIAGYIFDEICDIK